jgi:hypothetical protein
MTVADFKIIGVDRIEGLIKKLLGIREWSSGRNAT